MIQALAALGPKLATMLPQLGQLAGKLGMGDNSEEAMKAQEARMKAIGGMQIGSGMQAPQFLDPASLQVKLGLR